MILWYDRDKICNAKYLGSSYPDDQKVLSASVKCERQVGAKLYRKEMQTSHWIDVLTDALTYCGQKAAANVG